MMVNNECLQIGVVSFGESCMMGTRPTVYSSLTPVHGWIEKNVCALSANPPSTCRASVKIKEPVLTRNNRVPLRNNHVPLRESFVESSNQPSSGPTFPFFFELPDYPEFEPRNRPWFFDGGTLVPSDGLSREDDWEDDDFAFRPRNSPITQNRASPTDGPLVVPSAGPSREDGWEDDVLTNSTWDDDYVSNATNTDFETVHANRNLQETFFTVRDEPVGIFRLPKEPSVSIYPSDFFVSAQIDETNELPTSTSSPFEIEVAEAVPFLSSKKLGECEGDCDSDEDCGEGLYCFFKDAETSSVPGCSGFDTSRTDYCTKKRNDSPIFSRPLPILFVFTENPPKPENLPLQRCQGDCDSDADCAEGLICYERPPDRLTVPGCSGISTTRTDFCVDLDWRNAQYETPQISLTAPPTPSPTVVPASLPLRIVTSSPTTSSNTAPSEGPSKANIVTHSPTQTKKSVRTNLPTKYPTPFPTMLPTVPPTNPQLSVQTNEPTNPPTQNPTFFPTKTRTVPPTNIPTFSPTTSSTAPPTKNPTLFPTKLRTSPPTNVPTFFPTKPRTAPPTNMPTFFPTKPQTAPPVIKFPVSVPTKPPQNPPSMVPSNSPTLPTLSPTEEPVVVVGKVDEIIVPEEVSVTFAIYFDPWPQEVSWEIDSENVTEGLVASAPTGTYQSPQDKTEEIFLLKHGGNYTLNIQDSGSDGIAGIGTLYEVFLTDDPNIVLLDGNGIFHNSRKEVFHVPTLDEYPSSAPVAPTISPAPTVPTTKVYLTIVFDNWHQETAWMITDESGNLIAETSYDTYRSGETVTDEIVLPLGGTYKFTIRDFFNDGIKGGEYLMTTSDGRVIFSGKGDFGSFRSHTFTVPAI